MLQSTEGHNIFVWLYLALSFFHSIGELKLYGAENFVWRDLALFLFSLQMLYDVEEWSISIWRDLTLFVISVWRWDNIYLKGGEFLSDEISHSFSFLDRAQIPKTLLSDCILHSFIFIPSVR